MAVPRRRDTNPTYVELGGEVRAGYGCAGPELLLFAQLRASASVATPLRVVAGPAAGPGGGVSRGTGLAGVPFG
jgi:hypothetical protein